MYRHHQHLVRAVGAEPGIVLSNEGGHLIANLLAGGYGGENLWHTLLDIQSFSDPSLSGVITNAFLDHLTNCAAGSQIFATKLSGYTGTIAVSDDCSVTGANVQGSAFNGQPGTTSLVTSISGAGSATAVSSTSSSPLTSWTQNVAVGSGTATVTYSAFAILYTPGSPPSATPVPPTLWLTIIGCVALFGYIIRSRRRAARQC